MPFRTWFKVHLVIRYVFYVGNTGSELTKTTEPEKIFKVH